MIGISHSDPCMSLKATTLSINRYPTTQQGDLNLSTAEACTMKTRLGGLKGDQKGKPMLPAILCESP